LFLHFVCINVTADSADVTEVVPPLGDSVTSAVIKEWTKQAGDAVAMDEIVCVVETGA